VSDIDKIRSDIELTRAEMAKTIDALQSKLDVKAFARQRADDAGERAAHAYEQAKAAAPEPVRQALVRAEKAAAPVLAKAAADPKRTATIVGGAFAALLVIRRLRRAGRGEDVRPRLAQHG
jgi:hypothetical protein